MEYTQLSLYYFKVVKTEERFSTSQPLQGNWEMEDEDEDLPKVSFWELLKLNKEDWYLLLIGIVMSALVGSAFPLVSLLFSETVRVS